jgi:hypothetical protein
LPWGFAALAVVLDWIARGLGNPSVPASIFICLLILICVGLVVVIALQRDSLRKAGNYQKEGQKEAEKTRPPGPEDLLTVAGQKRGNQAEEASNDQKPARRRRFNWKLDFVAAFTGLLTFVTAIQVWAFIEGERAFLLPVSGHFEGSTLIPDKQLVLWLEIKNSGHSTAIIDNLNVSYAANALPALPSYSPDASIAFAPLLGGSINPIHSTSIWPDGRPFSLPKYDVDRIQNQTVRFQVFGFVQYHDFFSWFGSTRKTGFCYIYTPAALPAFSFDPCPEKNYTYAY